MATKPTAETAKPKLTLMERRAAKIADLQRKHGRDIVKATVRMRLDEARAATAKNDFDLLESILSSALAIVKDANNVIDASWDEASDG